MVLDSFELKEFSVETKRSKKNGIGSHAKQGSGDNDLWLTPPEILSRLGDFDLDPCACPYPRPWPTAKEHVALPHDGLKVQWWGRVFLNPPYGDDISVWMQKMAEHSIKAMDYCRAGIALTFARTDTEWFQTWVFPFAVGGFFIHGRLFFHFPDGTKAPHNAGGPSILLAYSKYDYDVLKNSGIRGRLVKF